MIRMAGSAPNQLIDAMVHTAASTMVPFPRLNLAKRASVSEFL
jgi:hypothetical protein